MKIVLIGYMASGKSSVGKLLAKELQMDFVDLDTYIEEQTEQSIKTIFAEKGEIFFRKKEHEMLQKVLHESDSLILSTGGGTPCYAGNMDVIRKNSDYSIYLQLTVPALVERIQREKDQRPLVQKIQDEELPEFVGKHLFERRQFYSQAMHTIDCNKKPLEAVVEEIKEVLV